MIKLIMLKHKNIQEVQQWCDGTTKDDLDKQR